MKFVQGKTQVAKIPESMVTSLKNQEKVRTKTLVKSATSVASKSPNVVKAEDSSSQVHKFLVNILLFFFLYFSTVCLFALKDCAREETRSTKKISCQR